MKKIGLVGGLGPASTVDYYLGLVRLHRERSNDVGYPEIVIDSVDMSRHIEAIKNKRYDIVSEYLLDSLAALNAAGAEVAAITANTEHIVWDLIRDYLPLPTVSAVEAVGAEIRKRKYKRLLVLGTEWTMSVGLFDKEISRADCVSVTPSAADRKTIGELIYPNLENGIVIRDDKAKMLELADKYITSEHTDAVLLGCTELPLMINDGDLNVPVLNSTEIHIREIYNRACK